MSWRRVLLNKKIWVVAGAGSASYVLYSEYNTTLTTLYPLHNYFTNINNYSDSYFTKNSLQIPSDNFTNVTSDSQRRLCDLIKRSCVLSPYHAHCKERGGSAKRHNFDFIADAAEEALPAVVCIDLVGHYDIFMKPRSSGTGFIVDKRGYIITNEHVIESFQDVVVTLQDETKLEGRVVAIDPRTDLALIKVESDNELPVIVMGDDASLGPGQWVCAIGNSISLPNTVTVGVVSNVSRDIKKRIGQNGKMGASNYVQTDAAINPGNSGGPLINLRGEVVAVNTMGLVGRANAMNFSIPISEVKRFLNEFKAGQLQNLAHSRYSLGIRTRTLTSEMVRFLHSKNKLDDEIEGGVFVYQTVRGSPAHHIGLRKGDVITKMKGKRVASNYDITVILKQYPDQSVNISFYRPGVGVIDTEIKPVPSNIMQ